MVHNLDFKIVDLFVAWRQKNVAISVTRWLHDLFNTTGPFTTMKIWPIGNNPKVGSKLSQILKQPCKKCQRLLKCYQSDKIFEYLVTLTRRHQKVQNDWPVERIFFAIFWVKNVSRWRERRRDWHLMLLCKNFKIRSKIWLKFLAETGQKNIWSFSPSVGRLGVNVINNLFYSITTLWINKALNWLKLVLWLAALN